MLLFENAIPSGILKALTDNWQWKERLECGGDGPIIAILLMLLPELRSLKIKHVSLKGILQTLQYIADSRSTGLLSKLEEVAISSIEPEIKGVSIFQTLCNVPINEKAVV
jgi:hypothetical protein